MINNDKAADTFTAANELESVALEARTVKVRMRVTPLMVGACPGCNGTGVRTSPVCPSLDLYSNSQCMICEGK